MSSHIDIKRKKSESFDAMFRRFSRRLQQSGKTLDVKSQRFFARKAKKNKLQESALRRLTKGARREFLLKTGKVTEDDLRKKRR